MLEKRVSNAKIGVSYRKNGGFLKGLLAYPYRPLQSGINVTDVNKAYTILEDTVPDAAARLHLIFLFYILL